jgi:hypothetical protein
VAFHIKLFLAVLELVMTPSDVFIINDNFWLQIAGTAWVQQAVAACMYYATMYYALHE